MIKPDVIKFKLYRREDCWKSPDWDLTIRHLGDSNLLKA